MSDFPFKPPVANPFSAKKKVEEPDPLNRVEHIVVAAPAAESRPIPEPKEPMPPMSMEEKSCRSCEYFSFDEKFERHEAYKGECRRHAPIPGNEGQAFWPEVPGQSWCGEWESGVSNEDMVRMARVIGERMAAQDEL